ncbi:Glutaredoxin 3 [Caenorhabditis elegans]|uniref:Glutaredoxin 3 n=1 Tax=Caenorhabditis elegans TaxID=6239 RepID=Q6EZG4_CAEEL|nr:Glutaredoxin 3 [Caenorhabditis elegans]CCD68479.1 Glutaredoxin 3 [Caenorhabditis elegans]|eukprot:NP_001023757.1 GLutaRedoXin [Caenorhabditis elegans]
MPIQEIKSGEEVAAFIKEPSPAVLHFYASWAPSCEQVNQLLDDLLAEIALPLRAAFIDAEALPGISLNFKITAAPTLVFFSNGKEVDRIDGFVPKEIQSKVVLVASRSLSQSSSDASSTTSSTPSLTPQQEKEALNARLGALVNSQKVMVFMKGDPSAPRCGFSRTIVELLNSHKIKFGSFDIFSDEAVRQGLKEYSNWPTYPQLYFDGELIGGLDVVKEEFSDPQFIKQLPKVGENSEGGSLEDRLKKLVSSQRLMLFMKGDRETPKCGFSRTIVDLLNKARADYHTFDILEDEEVRNSPIGQLIHSSISTESSSEGLMSSRKSSWIRISFVRFQELEMIN